MQAKWNEMRKRNDKRQTFCHFVSERTPNPPRNSMANYHARLMNINKLSVEIRRICFSYCDIYAKSSPNPDSQEAQPSELCWKFYLKTAIVL